MVVSLHLHISLYTLTHLVDNSYNPLLPLSHHFNNMLYILTHPQDNSYNSLTLLSSHFNTSLVFPYLIILHISLTNLLYTYYNLLTHLSHYFNISVYYYHTSYTSSYIPYLYHSYPHDHILLMHLHLIYHLHMSLLYIS